MPHDYEGRLYLTRDYRKRLLRGYQYSGFNANLLRNPHLHQLAQLEALKAEKASKLLEELTSLDVLCPEKVSDELKAAIQATDLVRYALSREQGYVVENSVNEHCSITVGTLYRLITDKTINVAYGNGAGRIHLMTRKANRTPKVTKHVVLGENLQKKKDKEKKKEAIEETKTGVAKIRPANNRY